MTERKRNNGEREAKQGGILDEISSMKKYQVTIFSASHTPPTFECIVKARSVEEASARAVVQGRNFMQAAVINNMQEAMLDVIKTIRETGSMSEEQYEHMVHVTPNSPKAFEIDGIMVMDMDRVRGKVMSEHDMQDEMFSGLTDMLKKEASKNEEE